MAPGMPSTTQGKWMGGASSRTVPEFHPGAARCFGCYAPGRGSAPLPKSSSTLIM